MKRNSYADPASDMDRAARVDGAKIGEGLNRRTFLQVLGAGLLITVTEPAALAQRRGAGAGGLSVAARLHIGPDGVVTVMTGKVEEGQGSRGELTQAAAEELRVSPEQVRMIMADTDLVPDDGTTAGSRTTPINVPAVRRGAATARELLERAAAKAWQVDPDSLHVRDGVITDPASRKTLSYGELAVMRELDQDFQAKIREDVTLTPLAGWKVMGHAVARPNRRDLVTGAHHYPSDVQRPGMVHAKVLRPPAYGAKLESIDLSAVEAMAGVQAVHDGHFVGCVASTRHLAAKALDAAAQTARWSTASQVSSKDLFPHLLKNARSGGRSRGNSVGDVEQGIAGAAQVLEETYEVAYVQHTPMETRAAVAEWKGNRLTVWTGVDGPHRVQGDLAGAFGVPRENVRVIVPDMGGGFGGKHTGEAAEEAARLARAVKRPVALQWTRAEEFTWAYFRPAAVIECRGGLDGKGSLAAWDFTNINAGSSGIATPYRVPHTRTRSLNSDAPLRQGAYRCLAATANHFARESFMDELAHAAGKDPLAFRLAHLDHPRMRTVLEEAARRFNWSDRIRKVTPELGVGLACGTEKNSVVAACAEVAIDRKQGEIRVVEVCEVFECGPIINPDNLRSQVQGCICMGLGPALREAVEFEDGKILTDGFGRYRVPRFEDVPKLDIHLVENHDIPSAGGGETPIIAIAPAMANAVFSATGLRIRSMPIRSPLLKA